MFLFVDCCDLERQLDFKKPAFKTEVSRSLFINDNGF